MNQMTRIPPTDGEAIASAVVERAALHRVAKLAAATVDAWTTLPVLSHARLQIEAGALQVAATDLDRETVARVEAETTGAATVLIGARTLAAFAQGAEGPVTITVGGEGDARRVTLSDGMTTLRLRSDMDPTDYPHQLAPWRARHPDGASFEISPAALLRLLRLARPCVSSEETRYYLHGVHLDVKPGGTTLRACATDGHRLAIINSDVAIPKLAERGAILPVPAVDMMLSLLGKGDGNAPWRVDFRGNALAFVCGDVEVWAKVIDGTFPNVDRVVGEPADNLIAHLNLGLLRRISALQRALDPQRSPAVELDCAAGTIRHRAAGGDTVEHALQGRAASGFDRIGFNLDYLLTIARLAGTVTVSARSKGDPARLVGDDPDALWIVMPMRL